MQRLNAVIVAIRSNGVNVTKAVVSAYRYTVRRHSNKARAGLRPADSRGRLSPHESEQNEGNDPC